MCPTKSTNMVSKNQQFKYFWQAHFCVQNIPFMFAYFSTKHKTERSNILLLPVYCDKAFSLVTRSSSSVKVKVIFLKEWLSWGH